MIRLITLEWVAVMPIFTIAALFGLLLFKRDLFPVIQWLVATMMLANSAFLAIARGLELVDLTAYVCLQGIIIILSIWVIFSEQPERLYKRLVGRLIAT